MIAGFNVYTAPTSSAARIYVKDGNNDATDSTRVTLGVPVIDAPGTAPLFACRAWVSFNGTGTVAIIGSGNVSSITDNGVGDYTVNFATDMTDDDYCVVGTCDKTGGNVSGIIMWQESNVDNTAIFIQTGAGVRADANRASVAIFR